MNEEIFDLKLKGYCCSQIIMEMGLRRLEKENDELVAAMAGLCEGLWQGKLCGALSAAVCLLYLADPKEAAKAGARDLMEWFEDAFGELDCEALLAGDPRNRVEKCPCIVEATFQKVEEILEWD